MLAQETACSMYRIYHQIKYILTQKTILYILYKSMTYIPPRPLAGTGEQNNCLLVYSVYSAKKQFNKCRYKVSHIVNYFT
jgi:hypothetical protein